MTTETLSALTKSTNAMLEPVLKLNQEAVATFEKLTARQIDCLKTCSDLGMSQLKVAAEVKDIEGLQHLLSKQTDVLRELGECFVSDFKALSEMGADFVSRATKVRAGAVPALSTKTKANAN